MSVAYHHSSRDLLLHSCIQAHNSHVDHAHEQLSTNGKEGNRELEKEHPKASEHLCGQWRSSLKHYCQETHVCCHTRMSDFSNKVILLAKVSWKPYMLKPLQHNSKLLAEWIQHPGQKACYQISISDSPTEASFTLVISSVTHFNPSWMFLGARWTQKSHRHTSHARY